METRILILVATIMLLTLSITGQSETPPLIWSVNSPSASTPITFVNNDSLIIVGFHGNSGVHVFEVETGEKLFNNKNIGIPIKDTPNGKYLIGIRGYERQPKAGLVRMETRNIDNTTDILDFPESMESPIFSISEDSKYLISRIIGNAGYKIWDIESMELVDEYIYAETWGDVYEETGLHKYWTNGVGFAGNLILFSYGYEVEIYVGGPEQTQVIHLEYNVVAFDRNTKSEVYKIEGVRPIQGSTVKIHLECSPDGKYFASLSPGGSIQSNDSHSFIQIFNAHTGEQLGEMKAYDYNMHERVFKFSENSQYLCYGTWPGTTKIYSVPDLKLKFELTGNYGVSFARNSNKVVSADYYTLSLYDYSNFTNVVELIQNLRITYPNPTQSLINFEFELHKTSQIKIEIIDAVGNSVRLISDRLLKEGIHSFQTDLTGLASGAYFLRIQGENFSKTEKIMLIK